MIIAVVAILVLIVLGLVIYNVSIHKKIQKFRNMNQKITNLYVVQDFINAIGETSTVEDKIKKINDILVERYEIKYSTIVVFNGAEYEVKASNVDKKHWNSLKSLQDVEMFKDSIESATPKYVTVNNENERLPYQQMEFGRAKSAIFFPLYIDNVYIGYWILESGKMHAFENIDVAVIEVVKDDIISILQTMSYQSTIENINRLDQFTGLNSEEYLYVEGKKKIDEYATSAVCMFRISNIEEINDTTSRKVGNEIIKEVSNIVKEKMPQEYVFVRYMGPKFVIVFSGVEEGSLNEFLQDMKQELEELEIVEDDGEYEYTATPRINFVVSTYYKGTALENLTKKLEEYLDSAPKSENQINYI